MLDIEEHVQYPHRVARDAVENERGGQARISGEGGFDEFPQLLCAPRGKAAVVQGRAIKPAEVTDLAAPGNKWTLNIVGALDLLPDETARILKEFLGVVFPA